MSTKQQINNMVQAIQAHLEESAQSEKSKGSHSISSSVESEEKIRRAEETLKQRNRNPRQRYTVKK